MGSKQFCLKWSHHQRNMLSNFGDLLNHEAFVDVTLACEGVCLKAHKVVLSACSPYFQKILIENPCQHPVVILQNIKCDEMQAILSFMYKGEMNVSQEQVSAILKIAEGLKIKGLADVTNEDFHALHRKGAKPTVIFVPAEGQTSPPAKRKKKMTAASRTYGDPIQLPESDLELHLLPRPALLPEQNITLSIQTSSHNVSEPNSVYARLEKEETVNVAPVFEKSVDHGPSTSKDKPPMHDLLGFMESSFVEIEKETSSQQVSQNSSFDFSYIKSTRGGDFVVRYGYLFKLNKTGPGGKRYYRDSKTGCKARAIISGGQITDIEGHNHETDDHEIAKREYKMLAMRSIMEESVHPIEEYHDQACQESILRNMKQEMENSIPTSRDKDLVGDENQEDYHMERHSNVRKFNSEESWYDSLSKQDSHLGKSTVGAS